MAVRASLLTYVSGACVCSLAALLVLWAVAAGRVCSLSVHREGSAVLCVRLHLLCSRSWGAGSAAGGFVFRIGLLWSSRWAGLLTAAAGCGASSGYSCSCAASEGLILFLSIFVSLGLHCCVDCVMLYPCCPWSRACFFVSGDLVP